MKIARITLWILFLLCLSGIASAYYGCDYGYYGRAYPTAYYQPYYHYPTYQPYHYYNYRYVPANYYAPRHYPSRYYW